MRKFFGKLNVAQKILALAILLLFIMIAIAGFSVTIMDTIQSNVTEVYRQLVQTELVQETQVDIETVNTLALEHILAQSNTERQQLEAEIASLTADVSAHLVELRDYSVGTDLSYIDSGEQILSNYAPLIERALEASNRGQEGAAQSYLDDATAYQSEFSAVFGEWINENRQTAREFNEQSELYFNGTRITFLIVLVVAVAVALLSTYFISRVITQPLRTLSKAANSVAQGDLAVTWNISNEDEVGTLSSALEKMVDNLKDLLEEIRETSGKTTNFSQTLAASTEQTGASIQEVAATANQFSSSAQVIASQAEDMNTNANSSLEKLTAGQAELQQAIDQINEAEEDVLQLSSAVDGLGKRSKEIQGILSTITQIAEQTNLLALNAAIEAARAGEHGRGFTVVSEEIRSLAEESTKAVEEVSRLINTILDETDNTVARMSTAAQGVREGSDQIDHTGETFETIHQTISDLVKQIQEISQAVSQMSSGSQQIASTTEEQSATVQEIASSSEDLVKLAERLTKKLEQFKGI